MKRAGSLRSKRLHEVVAAVAADRERWDCDALGKENTNVFGKWESPPTSATAADVLAAAAAVAVAAAAVAAAAAEAPWSLRA